jgi:hypothetical protein
MSEPVSMDVFRTSVGQSRAKTQAAEYGIESGWSHFVGGLPDYHGEEHISRWRETIESRRHLSSIL